VNGCSGRFVVVWSEQYLPFRLHFKLKYLENFVQYSDVVETVTSETETETWLKFRDETETWLKFRDETETLS